MADGTKSEERWSAEGAFFKWRNTRNTTSRMAVSAMAADLDAKCPATLDRELSH